MLRAVFSIVLLFTFAAAHAGEPPPGGGKRLKMGDFEVVAGTDPVCAAVKAQMAEKPGGEMIGTPGWQEAQLEPNEEPPGSRVAAEAAEESIYDFDNDGKLDRVVGLLYEDSYMNARVLLVQPGTSPKSFKPVAPLRSQATLSVACQVTGKPANFAECPPYSQKWNDAGFSFRTKRGTGTVTFLARYSVVAPMFYKGKSYLFISTISPGASNYVAVLKPLPHRKFEHTCLIWQVSENP